MALHPERTCVLRMWVADLEKATQIDERVLLVRPKLDGQGYGGLTPEICRGGKHILASLIFASLNKVPSRCLDACFFSAVATIAYTLGQRAIRSR